LKRYGSASGYIRELFGGVFGELGRWLIVVAEAVLLAAEGAVDGGFGIV
jgi:hypothetical protein